MTLGDYRPGDTIDFKFTTIRPSSGAPFTLAGTPAVSVYKADGTTETTTGVTLTVDFDSVTGLNHVRIVTSDAFYASGENYDVVITTGTVDSVSAVGFVVGRFSLGKTSCLKPTTAGRTLDVSAGGEAGIDLANVGSPTTTVNLSGTTIAAVTGAVGSVTGNVGGSVASVTGNVGGNVVGSVGSVTAAVTVGTNNDKTGYSLATAPPTAEAIADAVWDEATAGHTTAGTYGGQVLRGANSNVEVQVTGSNHVAADMHESQPGSIHATTFDAGAIDAAALATDAANEIADALLDRANAIETGLSVRGAFRLSTAALVGKLSGAATTTVTIRNVGDTTSRIVATVDADGNRSAVTTDAT